MRVIGFVNGSLAAETTAIYALHYAKKLEFPITLVYIQSRDSTREVELSVKHISKIALELSVECDYEMFESILDCKAFIQNRDFDMLFCSTRHDHSLLDNSFAKRLIDEKLKVDLAIIKIVKLSRAQKIEKIILPIRTSKLSIKKFTLFSSFALAYDAKAEIYSVDRVSKRELSKIDINGIKQRLQAIVFQLRHYFRAAKLMGFKFSIKHDFALVEGDRVKEHIAKHGYDLVIIGAHHDRSFWGHHPIDVIFKQPMINTIYFIPYKDEL